MSMTNTPRGKNRRRTRVNFGDSACDVVEENATLQQERSTLFLVGRATGNIEGWRCIRLLENRIALADLLSVGDKRVVLFAAKDDFLEEENVVFPIHLRFGDREDIVEKERAKVGDMVALPVFNAALQVLHRREVFCPALSLIDLIRDPLRGSDTLLELF